MSDRATDAWLSEMWPVVRGYRPGITPDSQYSGKRAACPQCGIEYAASYLPKHLSTRHPKPVENTVDSGESGAA